MPADSAVDAESRVAAKRAAPRRFVWEARTLALCLMILMCADAFVASLECRIHFSLVDGRTGDSEALCRAEMLSWGKEWPGPTSRGEHILTISRVYVTKLDLAVRAVCVGLACACGERIRRGSSEENEGVSEEWAKLLWFARGYALFCAAVLIFRMSHA